MRRSQFSENNLYWYYRAFALNFDVGLAMKTTKFTLTLALMVISATATYSEEILNRSVSSPGASMEQKVIYHPSEAAYLEAREERLEALRDGDPSAMVNPSDGPWMIVETTAMVGMEIGVDFPGLSVGSISAMEGRTHLRRITAAEDALFTFENE